MSLPGPLTLEECAEWSKTVEPFIPQLYDLPHRLLESTSLSDLAVVYRETNPLVSGFAFSLILGVIVLGVSELNRNYSQVDRLWSLLPAIYNIHFRAWASLNGVPTGRLDLIVLASVIWSVRLTFNYWRKGGYSVGSEDYRWDIIRQYVHPALFFIFNVTFISFIQNILLFLLAAPTYAILLASREESTVSASDVVFAAIQVGLVVTGAISDQQQWNYQNAKKEYQKTAKVPRGFKQVDLDRGFVTSGLWAYCRHPNFSAEQTIWYMLYQWSCYATKVLYNWTGFGAMFLIFLFQGSTWLTELITAGKYPEYKHYQKQVGMQIPTLTPYTTPPPKVIRTSELAKRLDESGKEKQK